jgi:RNA polymerase sigma factor FliA
MNMICDTEYTAVQRATPALAAADEARWLAEYAPLVKRVVRKFAAQADGVFERDDLEQIGLMGLMEALRRYGEPDDEFVNFAVVRVRGAVLDELRRQDWRTRSARQGAHKLRACERTLRGKLGRDPVKEEVCAALGIDGDEYDRTILDDCATEFMSFDELLDQQGDLAAGRTDGPEGQVLLRMGLEQALNALTEREQRVVQLYYECELTLAEIGVVLDLTTARICQLHRDALRKMRAYLERH